MVETSFNRKALAEVYNILIMLKKENFEKIPADIIMAIKNNMDVEYDIKWEEIEEGKMLEDAEKILSVLYTDYLATPEEKKTIMQLETIKYKDMYPMFRKKVQESIIGEENQEITIKKEKWIIRFFNKIKDLLKFQIK